MASRLSRWTLDDIHPHSEALEAYTRTLAPRLNNTNMLECVGMRLGTFGRPELMTDVWRAPSNFVHHSYTYLDGTNADLGAQSLLANHTTPTS
jgi:hypothetical protein